MLFFGNFPDGKMTLDDNDANASFFGVRHYYYLGDSMSPAGDVNKDGFSDILLHQQSISRSEDRYDLFLTAQE